jgi:hypothetical protein
VNKHSAPLRWDTYDKKANDAMGSFGVPLSASKLIFLMNSIPPLGTILRRYAASPGAAMYALAYAAAKTIQRTFFLAKPGHTNLRRHCLAMPTPASAPHNRALMTN